MNRYIVSLAASVVLASILGGCASVEVEPLENARDLTKKGLRFYTPRPYLLVTLATAEGGDDKKKEDQKETEKKPGAETKTASATTTAEPAYTLKVIYLPDFSKPYVIRINSGVGTSDVSITLTDGWNLTALNSKIDSKVPETIEAISKLIPTIIPLVEGSNTLIPGLYAMTFDKDSGVLTGLERVKGLP